jgi:hypothetical protein
MKYNSIKYFTIILLAVIIFMVPRIIPEPSMAYTKRHVHRVVKKKVAKPVSAQTILNSLKGTYPRYLNSATVQYGTANGYQAVCYYTASRIVVNPKHKATLTRILNHEVWHIIDWKDNGRIDWGENIPPANAASYKN